MAKQKRGKEQEDSDNLRPLHGGRHSISPEVLAHNQRERMLGAIASVVAEHGYTATTIGQITDTASVSKRTFYEHFDSKEECFLAAYDALDDYLATLMAQAQEGQQEWADEVAAALAALIRFLAGRPELASLYLLESAIVGEALVEARAKTTERLIALLAPGHQHLARGRAPVEGIEEALVGGFLTMLTRRVLGGQAAELTKLIPGVIEFALSPFLGPEQARLIAERHAS